MGCGASSNSEPPSREGSAGKARNEESDKVTQQQNGHLVREDTVDKNLRKVQNIDNNNGSTESLSGRKKKFNRVDPLPVIAPNDPQKPGQHHICFTVKNNFRFQLASSNLPGILMFLKLKADRLHRRDYPHKARDHRHTDKFLGLVMVFLYSKLEGNCLLLGKTDTHIHKWTNIRTDATKCIISLLR